MLFADHVQRHLFNDGVLTPENAAAEYQKLMDEIDRAVVGETARWGDNRVSSPYTHSDWLKTQNDLLTSYFPSRTSRVLSQLRSDGLYPSTSTTTPVFHVNGSELHGGYVVQGSALTMTASTGQIYFTTDGSDPRLPGGTLAPQATAYSGQLPLNANTFIKARLRAGDGSWSALGEAEFFVNDPAGVGTLAITEINYNPHESLVQFGDVVTDSDEFEFIEFANVGSKPIELANVRLVQTTVGNHLEGVSLTFAARTLSPGERTVVVANQNAFESRYGTGLSVAGEFGGRLNDGGELITLLDVYGQMIQQFEFNDTGSWPGRADGIGSTLEVIDTTGNYDLASNWRSSAEFGGSPAALGVGPLQDVVINEVLTHTDLPLVDMIELYNTTDAPIDIANWYLSDSRDDLLSDRVSWENTLIPAHGYLTADETQLGFGFHGQQADDAWLVEADATGKPLRFVDRVEFGATQNGVSLGRWANGSGDLFPMTTTTFGAENSGPLLDSLVISEVHYHPAPPLPGTNILQEDLEFVEIWNPTGTTVNVGGWRINRAVEFDFAADTQLAAGSGAVIVPFDPLAAPEKATAFRSVHGMPDDAQLFGPYAGVLDNGGEKLQLERPEDELQLGLGYVLVDRVRYDDLAPWPTSADGQGDSLHRVAADDFGDFTASWIAQAPTPGRAELDQPVGDLNGDGAVNVADIDLLAVYLRSQNPLGDVNHDNVTDRHDLNFFVHNIVGSTFGDASLDGLFNSSDLIQVFQRGEYEDNISENSTWAEGDWNGDGEFDSGDLVTAFQTGRYEQPAPAVIDNSASTREAGDLTVASSSRELAAAVDWLFAQDDMKLRAPARRRRRNENAACRRPAKVRSPLSAALCAFANSAFRKRQRRARRDAKGRRAASMPTSGPIVRHDALPRHELPSTPSPEPGASSRQPLPNRRPVRFRLQPSSTTLLDPPVEGSSRHPLRGIWHAASEISEQPCEEPPTDFGWTSRRATVQHPGCDHPPERGYLAMDLEMSEERDRSPAWMRQVLRAAGVYNVLWGTLVVTSPGSGSIGCPWTRRVTRRFGNVSG